MKVLVLGLYPPAADGRAWKTVDVVRELLRDGYEVEVVSPQRSAAHDSLDLAGIRGAFALARRARLADRLVVCDAALLNGLPPRWRARALGRWRDVDVRDVPDTAADAHREFLTSDLEPWPDRSGTTATDVMTAVRLRAAADRAAANDTRAHRVPAPLPTIRAMAVHMGKEIVRRSLGRHADHVIIPVNRVRAKVAVMRRRARRGGA